VTKLTVDKVVKALDCRSESDTGRNQILLHKKYGLDALVPHYIEAFPRIKSWIGRKYIIFWIRRYARKNPDVVILAKAALNDKSWKVRQDACAALAYALDSSALPSLRKLLTHSNETTREDAAAAIDAIESKNHHFFYDRKHAGNIFWDVDPEDKEQNRK